MKKWQKITFVAIGTGLLGLGGVALWQRENLQAVYEAMHYNPEELGSQIQSTKQEVEKVLEKYDLESIRRLTPQEEEQVKKGELSLEEAVERMLPTRNEEKVGMKEGVGTKEEAAETQDTPKAKLENTSQAVSKKESDLVKASTVKMYELQAKYLGLLGELEARGMQALRAIPSDQRTAQKMMSVGMPFMQEGLALESQCDGEVENVLYHLKEELVAIGADYDIVETMRGAYYTEKRLKKAYYLSLIPK